MSHFSCVIFISYHTFSSSLGRFALVIFYHISTVTVGKLRLDRFFKMSKPRLNFRWIFPCGHFAGSHWKGGGQGGQHDSPGWSSCGKGSPSYGEGLSVISWRFVVLAVTKDELLPWITLWVPMMIDDDCMISEFWGWFVTAPWSTPESRGFRIICRYDMSILQSPSYLHVTCPLETAILHGICRNRWRNMTIIVILHFFVYCPFSAPYKLF